MKFYFECDRGCAIRNYPTRDLEEARRLIRKEIGDREEIRKLRKATERDLIWIESLGGTIDE